MSSSDFVAIEGIDKTGKTLIFDILQTTVPEATFITDPTGIEPWDQIFVNGPGLDHILGLSSEPLPDIVKSFLFLTARHHCYKKAIQPALDDGKSVIADRFADSWMAYQSVYADPDFPSNVDTLKFFLDAHELCVDCGLLSNPDVTIVITTTERILKSRLAHCENPSEYEKDPQKLLAVQDQYQELMDRNSRSYYEITDDDQGIIDIYQEVEDILQNETTIL